MKQEKTTGGGGFDRSRISRILSERGGLAGWLVKRIQAGVQRQSRNRARLTLVERIALAPRQSLVLVEAEGRRVLIATSPEGGAAFFALDSMNANRGDFVGGHQSQAAKHLPRVSW